MSETHSKTKRRTAKAKIPPKSSSLDPVTRYATDVVEGREIAGYLVRAACQRHLDDLEHGEKRGIWWDWPAAERVLEFFPTVLRLAGGDHEGKSFNLHPSQQFIAGSLFGWKSEDGSRRFRVAFIEEGKGNGKSPFAAGIGLYMLTADGEARAECYAAAVDKDQAKIPFRDAVAMVDQSVALDSRLTRSGGPGNEWNLAYLETGSFFRPISSEYSGGRGKSGPRPHFALLDEVHEHPSASMVEFMRAGTKGRRQALILMITNSGVFDPTSVYSSYHDYAIKLMQRTQANDSFFAYVCTLDPCAKCMKAGKTQPAEDCDTCDDWRDREVWKKANPLLGVSITDKYLAEQVREATGMPSKESLVRRLNFCERTESADPFVSAEVWHSNAGAVDKEHLKGRRCWGGLDLSGKNALTALVLVFEPDAAGIMDVVPFFWTPEVGLQKREEEGKAPYAEWVREGYLITTPGKTIHYGFVASRVTEILAEYQIEAIAFDRHRIDDLTRELEDEEADVDLVPHGQGFIDMSPSIEALEDMLLDVKLRHGNNPVLTWNIANTVVRKDPAANRKFDKKTSKGRIDGAQALAMAAGLAKNRKEESELTALWI